MKDRVKDNSYKIEFKNSSVNFVESTTELLEFSGVEI